MAGEDDTTGFDSQQYKLCRSIELLPVGWLDCSALNSMILYFNLSKIVFNGSILDIVTIYLSLTRPVNGWIIKLFWLNHSDCIVIYVGQPCLYGSVLDFVIAHINLFRQTEWLVGSVLNVLVTYINFFRQD
jgi:hypothetical protein